MFSRRQFNSTMAFLPFVGNIFKNQNQKIGKQDLNEIFKDLDGYNNPRVLILYHDLQSAMELIEHLNIGPIFIDMSGASDLKSKIVNSTTIISFHRNRPGSNTLDPMVHNIRVFQEARYSQTTLLQDEKLRGRFTVIKSRYGRKGKVFDVFT